MNFVVLIAFLVMPIVAQRPYFAGSSPKGYYSLASRFRDTSSDVPSRESSSVNRLGASDNTVTTQKQTVNARGDANLVHRLNQLPKAQRPFRLLNDEANEVQRGPQGIRRSEARVQKPIGYQQTKRGLADRVGIYQDPSVFTNEAGDILVPINNKY